jgi:hypothetical protein
MKRTILFIALALCAIALVSAQENNRWGMGFGPGRSCCQQWGRGSQQQQRDFTPPENISVTGSLTIAQGMIAVTGNNATYLVRGLDRYIGFIDGLKEGATVTIQGYALNHPQDRAVKILEVQKMTLNEKEYDLGRPYRNNRLGPQYQQNQQPPQRQRGRR